MGPWAICCSSVPVGSRQSVAGCRSDRWMLCWSGAMILWRVVLLLWPLPAAGLLNSWTWRPFYSQRTAPRHIRNIAGDGVAEAKSEPPEVLVRDLLECFRGEFDNYDQVVQDRNAGLAAGPGGGHEHIHCSLRLLDPAQVPLQIAVGERTGNEQGREEQGEQGRPLAVVAAKYYFNGDANVVFRHRLYSFHACPPTVQGARGDAVMRLWRLHPSVERRLRAEAYDLTSFDWCHCPEQKNNKAGGQLTDANNGVNDVAERMVGCEIYWSRGVGTVGGDGDGQHSSVDSHEGIEGGDVGTEGYASGEQQTQGSAAAASTETFFVGLMGEDDSGTWISSQNVDGLDILVKDDIRVWRDGLWVNDRGFDREGNFVYGNQRGVPYKMRRVVAAGSLEWTLGEGRRTAHTYAEKMAAIGVTPGQRFGPPAPSRQCPAGVGGRSNG